MTARCARPFWRLTISMTGLAVAVIGFGGCVASRSVLREFEGATPLQWSVRMADSEIARRDDTLVWKAGGTAKWDYTVGLFTLSLVKLNERVHDPRYVVFTEAAIGSFIAPDGGIRGYKPEEHSLDNINPGRTALELYRLTGEERYRKAVDWLRQQLDVQPRTSEGGFWHKQRYPHQMWLDGLYMASPFYTEYASLFHEPAASFDDVAKQIRVVAVHTYDPASGLFYHGWDESKQQVWANKDTGASQASGAGRSGGTEWHWWTCWIISPRITRRGLKSLPRCRDFARAS